MKTNLWTTLNVKSLRAFAKHGYTARLAAEMLNRSYGATRFKAHVEGISFGKKAKKR